MCLYLFILVCKYLYTRLYKHAYVGIHTIYMCLSMVMCIYLYIFFYTHLYTPEQLPMSVSGVVQVDETIAILEYRTMILVRFEATKVNCDGRLTL